MADDPNRDILPVKEGSCLDTCRSNIDPRERHLVCKLDRYQLEDRYLRLLDEANNLKKLSNCQEDKIKRLATKLMRVSSNPRACMIALDVHDDKNKITALELENAKLKDKISVLRNQLLSHTLAGRSSSRSRNPQARPSSGRMTCRSENSRTKTPSCHCIDDGNDENDIQNYLIKIEELEIQKKEMLCRIGKLEKELSSSAVSNQREKVAENVEYIRVWRQMKQLNDKLIAAQGKNESLNVQINDLKRILEDSTKNNQDITTALVEEKKRMSEIDEQMLKAKNSQLSLREKDEQIKDLISEMKILQQHNSELIGLSSKYGQVELENVELKKKVSEQLQDQQTLKTAFSTEQANIAALQAANGQLLEKLQELQKNIDNLTVQLKSFQSQTEKHESVVTPQISRKQSDEKISIPDDLPELYKDPASPTERCRKCCETYEKIVQLEESVNTFREGNKLTDQFVQTEFALHMISVSVKDQETVMTPVKEIPHKTELQNTAEQDTEKKIVMDNSLTPEKMLKLLEQAQINTPMDAQRISQKDSTSGMLDLNQRHSNSNNVHRQQKIDRVIETLQHLEGQTDPSKILSMLFNILQEYSLIHRPADESTTLYRPISADENPFVKDVNNNIEIKPSRITRKNVAANFKKHIANRRLMFDSLNIEEKGPSITANIVRKGCSTKRRCSSVYNKLHQDKLKSRNPETDAKKENHTVAFDKMSECNCTDATRCYGNSTCGYKCCGSCSNQQLTGCSSNLQDTAQSIPVKSGIGGIGSSLQKNSNTVYVTRTVVEGNAAPYRLCDNKVPPEKNNTSDDDLKLKEYMKQLNKCRELLVNDCTMNNASGIAVNNMVDHTAIEESLRHQYMNNDPMLDIKKTNSSCSTDCLNDCIEVSSSTSDSFPLVIADGEGLVEIHILCLQLSTSARQTIFRDRDICKVPLYISWTMLDQETACTPTMKCPKLNYNSSFVYRVPDLFAFFNYVLTEYVVFQANAVHEDDNGFAVARAKLCIKDILDYPQNKLHYITAMNSVIPCTLGVNFGQLSLWVRLSCDVEKVDAFKKQCGLYCQDYDAKRSEETLEQESKDSLLVIKDMQSNDTRDHSRNLFASFDSNLQGNPMLSVFGENTLAAIKETQEKEDPDVEYRNPGKRTMPDETNIIKNDANRVNGNIMKTVTAIKKDETGKGKMEDEMREEGIQAQTPSIAEFNNIMTNNNSDAAHVSFRGDRDVTEVLSEKNWEQYKQRSLLTFGDTLSSNTQRTVQNGQIEFTNNPQHEKSTITIEIVNVFFFQTSFVVRDDDIQLIYVEYTFLGYRGVDMETNSVEKPKTPNQKLIYNFRRKFFIDEEHHSVQRNTLRAMLNESVNPNIKFVIVSEPTPEETDVKECMEVGYANFNIREYALGDSRKTISLPIMHPQQDEQIGVLKILVLGVDAIRQCLGENDDIV